jgi:ParB family chromosome partitioning protein
VENVQRENLDDIELANAFQRLLLDCGLSHEQLSERIGKSRSAITNALRLLKLPQQVQDAMHKKQITMGHARALLALETEHQQIAYCNRVIEDGLSVRDIEKLTQSTRDTKKETPEKKTAKKEPESTGADPNLNDLIEKLRYRFGTQVAIESGPKGHGKVEISYYTKDDLNRIIDLLLRRDG